MFYARLTNNIEFNYDTIWQESLLVTSNTISTTKKRSANFYLTLWLITFS